MLKAKLGKDYKNYIIWQELSQMLIAILKN